MSGFLYHLGTVVVCIRIRRICATLNIHPNREFGTLCGTGRSEDIDEETILGCFPSYILACTNTYWAKLSKKKSATGLFVKRASSYR